MFKKVPTNQQLPELIISEIVNSLIFLLNRLRTHPPGVVQQVENPRSTNSHYEPVMRVLISSAIPLLKRLLLPLFSSAEGQEQKGETNEGKGFFHCGGGNYSFCRPI